MRPDLKRISALAIIALATILSGANAKEDCTPSSPAPCYPDNSKNCYCLGPENRQVNAPVRPFTCDGDFSLTVAAFCWKAEQDGMEYAIKNEVVASDMLSGNGQLNDLINAKYQTPHFGWDFGFKLGLAYHSSRDGWDIGALWTSFKDGTTGHVDADFEDNVGLLPLWSAFQFPNAGQAPILFATNIDTFWKLNLNVVDIALGRESWNSRSLSLRPHVGLRVAFIDQLFQIKHRGGSWNDAGMSLNFNDWVKLENDYKGVGVRSGLDTTWRLGRGFGLYGNFAASIVYGKFSLAHKEWLQDAVSPFTKIRFFETAENFRASRAILDTGLGIQWAGLVSNCRYGLSFSLGFEEHLFFHQNQLWRVVRRGGTNGSGILNSSGQNVFEKRRGDLDTYGLTLTGNFVF